MVKTTLSASPCTSQWTDDDATSIRASSPAVDGTGRARTAVKARHQDTFNRLDLPMATLPSSQRSFTNQLFPDTPEARPTAGLPQFLLAIQRIQYITRGMLSQDFHRCRTAS